MSNPVPWGKDPKYNLVLVNTAISLSVIKFLKVSIILLKNFKQAHLARTKIGELWEEIARQVARHHDFVGFGNFQGQVAKKRFFSLLNETKHEFDNSKTNRSGNICFYNNIIYIYKSIS